MTSNSLIPITYGGGIKNLYDIEKCLNTGCEKIVINSFSNNQIKCGIRMANETKIEIK